MKNIYLDYAATTPTDHRVIKAMKPYWYKNFANPSSLYNLGQKVKTDTYVWTLRTKYQDGDREFFYRGHVNILP